MRFNSTSDAVSVVWDEGAETSTLCWCSDGIPLREVASRESRERAGEAPAVFLPGHPNGNVLAPGRSVPLSLPRDAGPPQSAPARLPLRRKRHRRLRPLSARAFHGHTWNGRALERVD